MRNCVVFHYYEGSRVYADNFRHFLQFGCEGHDVICLLASDVSFDLPQRPNVRYLRIENRNFDYGGHAHAVRSGLLDGYDHILFVNNSVRGPFWPAWFRGVWTDAFFAPFRDDASIGIVGVSINIPPADSKYTIGYRARHGGSGLCAHVQSFAFALSQQSLSVLRQAGFFDAEGDFSKDRMILDYEIHLSQLLLTRGFTLRCLMPEYNSLNFAGLEDDGAVNPTAQGGDPSFKFAYLGRTPHPYETVFAKTNRDIHPPGLLEALAFSMQSARPQKPDLMFAEAGARDAFLQLTEAGRVRFLWRDVKKQIWKKIDPKRFRKQKPKALDFDV